MRQSVRKMYRNDNVSMKYTYICKETGEEREVSHGMDETPEILTKCGKVMKRKIHASTSTWMDKLGRSKR